MENTRIIGFFKDEDQQEISTFYESIRPKFINWLKGKYRIVEPSDSAEIYQRSFTIMYVNAKKGKLDAIDASVETYLFGVAKLVIQEWQREQSNGLVLVADQTELEVDIQDFTQLFKKADLDDSLVRKMQRALNTLGDPCRTILKLFYWEQNSMESIAQKTGYKNETVAKKKKYSCLQKLKSLMVKQ